MLAVVAEGAILRRSASPSARQSHRNTGSLQIAADRFPADMYGLFNAPQRPAQPSQRDDLLSLFLAQDIAHIDGAYSSRQDQCPGSVAPLAAFQVITIGRIWVIPEASELVDSRRVGPGVRLTRTRAISRNTSGIRLVIRLAVRSGPTAIVKPL